METLEISQVDSAPDHPVLPRAKSYDAQALRFYWLDETAVLEIEASTQEDYAVLRFEGVKFPELRTLVLSSGIRLSTSRESTMTNIDERVPGLAERAAMEYLSTVELRCGVAR